MTQTQENRTVWTVFIDVLPTEAPKGSWERDILKRGPDGSVSDLPGDSVSGLRSGARSMVNSTHRATPERTLDLTPTNSHHGRIDR